MEIPKQAPKPGFYYHYKHQPRGPVNDYAYEFMGVGYHTETGEAQAVYRPLYREASVYQAGRAFDVRPLKMWLEEVEKGGQHFLRFTPITDPTTILVLERIKLEMYGHVRVPKLVRDKIPELIKGKGQSVVYHQALSEDEYLLALWAKLWEEITELRRDPSVEEFADVQEVLWTLARKYGLDEEECERKQRSKNLERGGFEGAVILDGVLG